MIGGDELSKRASGVNDSVGINKSSIRNFPEHSLRSTLSLVLTFHQGGRIRKNGSIEKIPLSVEN